jgi:DNA-binding transcriptional LysR family regulator
MSKPPTALPAATLLNRLLARTRLRQLQVLVRAAELGSIQRAATEVGLSQAAATKAVAELERLVEVRLLERHARGVRPTAVGHDLLPLLRSMLGALHGCAEALGAHSQRGGDLLRIGAITGAVTALLTRALPEFADRHPGVHVELTEATPEVLDAGFADGRLDAVLVRRPAIAAAGSRFEPLYDDRAVVCCGIDHPLARRREVRLPQLLEEEWLLPPLGSMMREAFERLFEPFGRAPARTRLTTRSLALVLLSVRDRRVLAMAPASNVDRFIEAGLLRALPVDSLHALPPVGMLLPEAGAKRAAVDLLETLLRQRAG